MFGDVVKGLELLLKAFQSGPNASEARREALAKELLGVYRDIDEVVNRGREILALLGKDTLVHQGIAVTLLTHQHEVLQRLGARLQADPLRGVLQVHMPRIDRELHCYWAYKGWRVWFALDQLLSEGQSLSREEWIRRLEARMVDLGDEDEDARDAIGELRRASPNEFRGDSVTMPVLGFTRVARSHVAVLATPEQIRSGHALLDQFVAANQEIRKFLVENFKFEDLL